MPVNDLFISYYLEEDFIPIVPLHTLEYFAVNVAVSKVTLYMAAPQVTLVQSAYLSKSK